MNYGKEVMDSGKVLRQVTITLVIQNLGIKKIPFFMLKQIDLFKIKVGQKKPYQQSICKQAGL